MKYLSAAVPKASDPLGQVVAPSAVAKIGPGEVGINNFLGTIVQLIFTVASVGFIFMVLISALQMIFSGGDKEALAKARGRLTWAIIGIVLLALSFVIFRVIGDVTGFNLAGGDSSGSCTRAIIQDCESAGLRCAVVSGSAQCVK